MAMQWRRRYRMWQCGVNNMAYVAVALEKRGNGSANNGCGMLSNIVAKRYLSVCGVMCVPAYLA